jgi:dTDP-4-amino-4,6-dideoxygalactose transaminase
LSEWKVPLFDLDLGEEEYERVKGVLDSNWLTMGEVTRDFESAFAEYLGVKHALAVSSGTAAMHLAHNALGLEQGDEAICPSLTFVATANAIGYTGATPVFADIASLDELTISPDDIESRINERTKAIVVVHYGGFPSHMDRIMEIARRRDLFVVEDAAHAVGAEYSPRPKELKAESSKLKAKGAESSKLKAESRRSAKLKAKGAQSSRLKAGGAESSRLKAESSRLDNGQRTTDNGHMYKVGAIGDTGCFSFFSNKNMTTAEGGMVVTNHDALAEKMRTYRSHGMTSLTWDRYKGHDFSYDVVGRGFNYRIDELRSSLGLAQLEKLDQNNTKRRALWSLYRQKLNSIDGIAVPFSHFKGISSCHIFPVLLSEKVDRNGLMKYLREKGVQTSIHYPPIHLFSYYRSQMPSRSHLPVTEHVGRTEVTLPLFPSMEEQQVDYVVECVKSYLTRSQ